MVLLFVSTTQQLFLQSKVSKWLSGTAEIRDPFTEIGVTVQALRAVGCVSGSWIRVRALHPSGTGGWRRGRLVYFPAASEDPSGPTATLGGEGEKKSPVKNQTDGRPLLHAFLCEQAAFNFGIRHPSEGTILEVELGAPPLDAIECIIARVKSPRTSGHQNFAKALSLFFEHPRLLHVGDIFAVPVPLEGGCSNFPLPSTVGPGLPQDGNGGPNIQEIQAPWGLGGLRSDIGAKVAYFQVVEIKGHQSAQFQPLPDRSIPGFLVSQRSTTLKQSGALNHFVPNPQLTGVFARKVLQASLDGSQIPALCDESTWKSYASNTGMYQDYLEPKVTDAFRDCLLPSIKGEASLLLDGAPAILVAGRQGSGRSRLVYKVAMELGLHVCEFEVQSMLGNPGGLSVAVAFQEAWRHAQTFCPCICLLRGLDPSKLGLGQGGGAGEEDADRLSSALRATQWSMQQKKKQLPFGSELTILVATTDNLDDLPGPLRAQFLHEIKIALPGEMERRKILENLLKDVVLSPELDLVRLARQFTGRTEREIKSLVAYAANNAIQSNEGGDLLLDLGLKQHAVGIEEKEDMAEISHSDNSEGKSEEKFILSLSDFTEAEKKLQIASSMKVAVAKVPEVKWEDVGGLGHVRKDILDIVELPLKCPHLFASGLKRRSGILLYGPPGTGKTLIAKAVATECQMSFLSVKGPELLDMYIGESEKNVRNVFAQARSSAPSVLFFDELDSLAPQRGRGSDSGGVMDRVVAQILAEIDGVAGRSSADESGGDLASKVVIVMGATNRPDLLDPSLLRPGRFDRLLYLGTSQDHATQLKVLRAVTRKFSMEEDANLEAVLDLIPPQFTGADISAVASNAFSLALQRRVHEIEEEVQKINRNADPEKTTTARTLLNQMSEDELVTKISFLDFQNAAALVTPSVSMEELAHYERLKVQFSGRGP